MSGSSRRDEHILLLVADVNDHMAISGDDKCVVLIAASGRGRGR